MVKATLHTLGKQAPKMAGEHTFMSPMGRIRHIHFVGIGGAGMGGIAEVLFNLGYKVSGSDLADNSMTQRLKELGLTIYQGHAEEQVSECDAIVVSTAVKKNNVEVVAAFERNLPVVPRAEMLAELMRFRFGIAVAGTHGKTTATSLISSLLAEAELDPTYVIGGLLNSTGSNAKLGAGKYLVAEADESDASFLYLQPMMAVVTNIDADHMETYGGDFDALKTAFVDFLHHMPFYGLAVLCGDDSVVNNLLERISRPVLTYGFTDGCNVQAVDVEQDGERMSFNVQREGKASLPVNLNLAGEHNVLNALAAIAVAGELGVEDKYIQSGLEKFQGIDRRFSVVEGLETESGSITFVDDYGHHPCEIEATLSALRSGWPDKRLVVIFQPHRYSRTRDLFEDFVRVLSSVDVLLLLEVYPAGEPAIAEADGRALCRAIRMRGQIDPVFIEQASELKTVLLNKLAPGDVLLTLGAGDVGVISKILLKEWL